MDPLFVGPSDNRKAWAAALRDRDDNLLMQLSQQEPPGVVAFEIATYINGIYRMARQMNLEPQMVMGEVGRARACFDVVRILTGWRQREIDLGLMRWIRRASALTVVIGAGVTMAAGGPSWPALVRRLLLIALEKGHERTRMVPTPESTVEHRELKRQVIGVDHFAPEADREARAALAAIDAGAADTEVLMRGAQLCYDLFGQHLFTHLTGILYENERQPSDIHRAIATLAHPMEVPDRGAGLFPGWDAVISYNFDDLMGEALDAEGLPRVAWAMRGEEIAGDPNEQTRKANSGSPYQSIYHLHGYTPRRLFHITEVRYVFSTSQYAQVYPQRNGIIDHTYYSYLANPVHHALYVGCSFDDEAMNNLLRDAALRFPGRPHYALLHWPGAMAYSESPLDEIDSAGARYREIGVEPVWFDDFNEIPGMIRSLA